MIDKKNIIKSLEKGARATLELGCGPTKRYKDAIGIDLLDYEGVDIVGDIFDVLESFPESSVIKVYSYHFFEHIADQERLLQLISRVLQTGGELNIVVPHFSNPFYYSDPTHKSFFGLYTFSYLADDPIFTRTVPKYGKVPEFTLSKVFLAFKSYPPRCFRHSFKKALQFIFNVNTWMQEFYEENLCYIFPCYEIFYTLNKK